MTTTCAEIDMPSLLALVDRALADPPRDDDPVMLDSLLDLAAVDADDRSLSELATGARPAELAAVGAALIALRTEVAVEPVDFQIDPEASLRCIRAGVAHRRRRPGTTRSHRLLRHYQLSLQSWLSLVV